MRAQRLAQSVRESMQGVTTGCVRLDGIRYGYANLSVKIPHQIERTGLVRRSFRVDHVDHAGEHGIEGNEGVTHGLSSCAAEPTIRRTRRAASRCGFTVASSKRSRCA